MNQGLLIQVFIKAIAIHEANNSTMSVVQCAEFLGCHRNTVTNRIDKGVIKAVVADGNYSIPKIQFLEKIVDDFLKNTDEEVFKPVNLDNEIKKCLKQLVA